MKVILNARHIGFILNLVINNNMRKKLPKVGETRIKLKFALFPKNVEKHRIWLECYWVYQEYVGDCYWNFSSYWYTKNAALYNGKYSYPFEWVLK